MRQASRWLKLCFLIRKAEGSSTIHGYQAGAPAAVGYCSSVDGPECMLKIKLSFEAGRFWGQLSGLVTEFQLWLATGAIVKISSCHRLLKDWSDMEELFLRNELSSSRRPRFRGYAPALEALCNSLSLFPEPHVTFLLLSADTIPYRKNTSAFPLFLVSSWDPVENRSSWAAFT